MRLLENNIRRGQLRAFDGVVKARGFVRDVILVVVLVLV